jgi:Cu2+-exporting ATPase
MRFASLILTTPVVFYSAWPFFQGAWRDLKLKRAGMDVPVALGVGAAYAASVYGSFVGSAEVYFDAVTMFVFFLLTGRFLEMSARKRSAEAAESLVKLIPAAAMRLPGYPASREEETVAAVNCSRRAITCWWDRAKVSRPTARWRKVDPAWTNPC